MNKPDTQGQVLSDPPTQGPQRSQTCGDREWTLVPGGGGMGLAGEGSMGTECPFGKVGKSQQAGRGPPTVRDKLLSSVPSHPDTPSPTHPFTQTWAPTGPAELT